MNTSTVRSRNHSFISELPEKGNPETSSLPSPISLQSSSISFREQKESLAKKKFKVLKSQEINEIPASTKGILGLLDETKVPIDLNAFTAVIKVAKEKTLMIHILQRRMQLCPLETLRYMKQLHLLPFELSEKNEETPFIKISHEEFVAILQESCKNFGSWLPYDQSEILEILSLITKIKADEFASISSTLGKAIFEDKFKIFYNDWSSHCDSKCVFMDRFHPAFTSSLHMQLFLNALCAIKLPYEEQGEVLLKQTIKDYIERLQHKKISIDGFLHGYSLHQSGNDITYTKNSFWYGKELNPSRSKMVVEAFAEKEPVEAFSRILTYSFLTVDVKSHFIELCGKAKEKPPEKKSECVIM